ncbi:unnamed protein product [Symbiodinium sp. CCMP2592]|nr:unnamed protein product [Symbiodinium sp. CCMP2592]
MVEVPHCAATQRAQARTGSAAALAKAKVVFPTGLNDARIAHTMCGGMAILQPSAEIALPYGPAGAAAPRILSGFAALQVVWADLAANDSDDEEQVVWADLAAADSEDEEQVVLVTGKTLLVLWIRATRSTI